VKPDGTLGVIENTQSAQGRLAASGFTDFTFASAGPAVDYGIRKDGSLVFYAVTDQANSDGVFGDGTTQATVGQLVSPLVKVKSASVYNYDPASATACAVLQDGSVSCWGGNTGGQLGTGSSEKFVPTPATLDFKGALLSQVEVGRRHACALTTLGDVYCWGDNEGYGNIIEGSPDVPTLVTGLSGVMGVSGQHLHECAWTIAGEVYCWGLNASGQLGDGTYASRAEPMKVAGLSNVISVRTGPNHSCALLKDGTVQCWGSSVFGQIGNGVQALVYTPCQVVGL
jgi:hypothetical protein